MSEEIANYFGMKIGEKVLYPDCNHGSVILRTVTIKDVKHRDKDGGIIVVYVEEFDDCLDLMDVYTKQIILEMFERKENSQLPHPKDDACQ